MLPIRGSAARTADDVHFRAAARDDGEDNLGWLSRQLRELRRRGRSDTFVVLIGGTGIYDFRLMVAQSHLRHDMTPSYWSHAAVLVEPDNRSLGRSLILECSLEPMEGFGLPSRFNGLQGALLSRYADPLSYPNIALLRVPVPVDRWRVGVDDIGPILSQFARQRSVVDVPSLITEWLGFVWGAATEGNPLLRGHGIPSAVVIESILGAAGYDLCPGVDSAAVCPEAFWQTAKWWTQYLDALNLTPLATRYAVAAEDRPGPQTPAPSLRTVKARGLVTSAAELTVRLFDDTSMSQ